MQQRPQPAHKASPSPRSSSAGGFSQNGVPALLARPPLSCLSWPVHRGCEDAAEWLLSTGAKIDGSNKLGETPLIVAVQLRQIAMIKYLLDHGANPDKVDAAQGYSAREYAERDNRGRQIVQLIEAKKPK